MKTEDDKDQSTVFEATVKTPSSHKRTAVNGETDENNTPKRYENTTPYVHGGLNKT